MCFVAVSTAPAVTSSSNNTKQALTKNQRKKLKKKLKKALHQSTTAVAPEDDTGPTVTTLNNSTTEHAQNMGVELGEELVKNKDNDDSIKGVGLLLGEKLVLRDDGEALEFFVTPENGLVDIMETSITSSALSTRDQLTIVEREKSEVSSISEGSPGEEGVVCEEEEGAEEEGEEGEVDVSRWGPLKVPVTVKIADLGNACWVVSLKMCLCMREYYVYMCVHA